MQKREAAERQAQAGGEGFGGFGGFGGDQQEEQEEQKDNEEEETVRKDKCTHHSSLALYCQNELA